MFFKFFSFILLAIFLISCSGNYQEARKKRLELDPCSYETNKTAKEICEVRERGRIDGVEGSESLFKTLLGDQKFGSSNTYKSNVNQWLWQGSLETVSPFSVRIADAFGGYIETDWIINEDDLNKRCSIKIQITSPDFISNGVNASLVCQKNVESNWVTTADKYDEESRKIVNAILNNARKKFQQS